MSRVMVWITWKTKGSGSMRNQIYFDNRKVSILLKFLFWISRVTAWITWKTKGSDRMENQIYFNQETIKVEEVKLHIPEDQGHYFLFLSVSWDGGNKGFGLWNIELARLKDINGLHLGRIHIQPGGETYDDDTLGSDIVRACEVTDLNYWNDYPSAYDFGEILVDFERIEGNSYRVNLSMTLGQDEEEFKSERELENYESLEIDDPARYPHTAKATFTVTVDERHPN